MPQVPVPVVWQTRVTLMKQPLDMAWERDLIDQIDGLILSMLRRRREHSQQLQHRKASAGLTVYDPAREREIVAWYDRYLPGGGPIAKATLDCCRGSHAGSAPPAPPTPNTQEPPNRPQWGLSHRLSGSVPAQPPTSKDLQMDPQGGCPT